MMKYILRLCLLLLCCAVLSACNTSREEETMPTTKPISMEAHVEELIIPAGDRTIYGKIYYPTATEKCPAVILSHGYNGCHTDFLKECKYFSDNGFIAYTFDFCGGSTRSRSSGASTDMTIFTEKEDLLAIIDHLLGMKEVDESRLFLLGGSQGGLVTALAAEERADQVRGMVLYFPAYNIPDDWRRNYQSVDQIPEVVDFWGLKLGKNFFVSMREFVSYDHIGGFQKEILILQGDKDAIVPVAAVKRAAKIYEQAELVILPGEGHGFSPAGGKTAMEKALSFMQSLG